MRAAAILLGAAIASVVHAGVAVAAPVTGCPTFGVDTVVSPQQASSFIGAVADDGAGGVYLTETDSLPGAIEKLGVARYDHAGTRLWSAQWQRDGGTHEEAVLAIADAGGVFAIATTYFGNTPALAIVRYAADGTLAWQVVYHPTDRDEPISARADGAGGVLVSGYGDDGWFLVRYGPDGTQRYARRLAGGILFTGIGLDAAGNAYVGGSLDDASGVSAYRISPLGSVEATFTHAAAVEERLETGALAVTPDGAVRLAVSSSTFVQLPDDPPGLLGSHQAHLILGFAPDASLEFTFVLDGTSETTGVEGAGGPTRALLDDDGNLYVSGSLRRQASYLAPLYKLSAAGALLWRVDLLPPAGGLVNASDLVLDPDGVTLAASFGGAPVLVARVTADGVVTSLLPALSGVGGPAVSVAADGTTFAAITLGARENSLNMVRLLRLDAPSAPAGTLIAPRRLDFKGKRRISRPIAIRNKSRTDCLAVQVGTPAAPFVAGGLLMLAPRGEGAINVAFVPPYGARGRFKADLALASSDPRKPLRTVRLSGRR